MEIWKDITGYEGLYQVSNTGKVRSLDRITNGPYGSKRLVKGRELVLHKSGSGYLFANLAKDSKHICKEVHRLVMNEFVGPRFNDLVVDHIDNNKLNNHVSNLQYVTHRFNSSKDKSGSSKYTGVYWNKDMSKWHARIRYNGKKEHLGYHKCELAAAYAYNKRLKEISL